MLGSAPAVTTHERDLGVTVDSSLKKSTQCAAATKKVSKMLVIIQMEIGNKMETSSCQYSNPWCTHILKTVLVPTSEKGCNRITQDTEKSKQNDQGHGVFAIPGKTKKARTVQFGNEKAEGGYDKGL